MVNERAIEFDAPTAYASLNNYRPTPADLLPVAIASEHAALDVRQLRIRRDLYYLSSLREPLLTSADREEGTNEVIDTLSTPSLWGRLNLLEPSELYPLAKASSSCSAITAPPAPTAAIGRTAAQEIVRSPGPVDRQGGIRLWPRSSGPHRYISAGTCGARSSPISPA